MDKKIFKGKRIAITAHNLEQKEHRGIALFTKSLIRSLSKYGAEIYLITGIESKRLKIFNHKSINYQLEKELFLSDLYSTLKKGVNYREQFRLSNRYKFKLCINLLIDLISLYSNRNSFKYEFCNTKEHKNFINIVDSRLDYLNFVKGFIFVKNIFHISRLRSMRLLIKDPELNLKKIRINLIISTSPLSLKCNYSQNAEFLQFIHDAIPLQVTDHLESPFVFFNKLLDANKNSKCVYISKESKRIVGQILNIKNDKEPVIYPMPSLKVDKLEEAYNNNYFKSINRHFVLFISSIVESKRVEKAISYFKKSNLPKRNFVFCIAGKLHNTKYCSLIKDLCIDNKDILLLDYVNEFEKAWLFLNCSLLISTTSIEGFGIPLLDALSINLQALATSIPSHLEINDLKKNKSIKLINQNDSQEWIDWLNKTTIFDINNSKNKLKRIEFFKCFMDEYEEKTLIKISKFLM